MPLTPYTTPADVRAACGLSEDDVDDATLGAQLYELVLRRELRAVSTTLLGDFATWGSEAAPNDQQLARDCTVLFATYAVARELCAALPLMANKDISDGKASAGRFTGAPYQAVMDRVEAAYQKAREDLAEAVSALQGTQRSTWTVRTVLLGSTPGYDPVTGS